MHQTSIEFSGFFCSSHLSGFTVWGVGKGWQLWSSLLTTKFSKGTFCSNLEIQFPMYSLNGRLMHTYKNKR